MDTEKATQICALITAGASVRAAAGEVGVDQSTVFRWLADPANEMLRKQYARAREIRADARFERIDQVIADMREGTVDSAQARVEIDAVKWQCGKESPKRYGDHLSIDAEVTTQTMANVLRGRRQKRGTPEQGV